MKSSHHIHIINELVCQKWATIYSDYKWNLKLYGWKKSKQKVIEHVSFEQNCNEFVHTIQWKHLWNDRCIHEHQAHIPTNALHELHGS
jgi:hypothetical protein